jgi:4-hydroxy-2-oxoheptanedioate aldolase
MQLPINLFKRALLEGRLQIGLWHGLANPYVSELLAGTGFDWICIDAEHSPNDPRLVLCQLQAIAAYPVNVVVRALCDDAALLKQYLDIGAQTLLIPMVESAQQAKSIVAATRYPPGGIRGVGSALARASRWNQIPDYLHLCERELCVLVQVESMLGMQHLAEVAAVEGVDGVFFGPSDLAGSMGLLGQANHPKVQQVIADGISVVRKLGKSTGILTADALLARKYIDLGVAFVAVGLDTSLLVRGAQDLARSFKQPT